MNPPVAPPAFQAHAPKGRLNPQKTIAVLAVIMALQMTSYVMILPLFARRFEEFGAGVKSLGFSSMAFAVTSAAAAPFMGMLADRLGRRPLVIGSLVSYIAAFLGFLLAPTANTLIVVRGLAGAFTVGLVPAITGLASDIAPQQRRAQWIGYVIGGASFGWVAGPLAGGALFDGWGFKTALIVSIGIASLSVLVACLMVPESLHPLGHPAVKALQNPTRQQFRCIQGRLTNLGSVLPKNLPTYFVLLFICFAVMFAWAFMEPEFMFYAYDDLGWSSSMLGLAMSTYGAALMAGEFAFGQLSDRWGRKPVILIGLVLFSSQFLGLALFRSYALLVASFIIAGLGNSLYDPALTAAIMDISPSQHRARILGYKHSAGLSGNILGPALIVLVTSYLGTGSIFLISTGIVLLATSVGLSLKITPQPGITQAGQFGQPSPRGELSDLPKI